MGMAEPRDGRTEVERRGIVKRLKFRDMLASLRQGLEGVPEHRTGRNTQYTIVEAGLGAFSVFFMQSPSFLAHQRDIQRNKGENNAEPVWGGADTE
jgi:hypothetical protein